MQRKDLIIDLHVYCLLVIASKQDLKSTHHNFSQYNCFGRRFWLGALSNKGGRGQRNREEIGADRGFATRAPGSTNRHATQASETVVSNCCKC